MSPKEQIMERLVMLGISPGLTGLLADALRLKPFQQLADEIEDAIAAGVKAYEIQPGTNLGG